MLHIYTNMQPPPPGKLNFKDFTPPRMWNHGTSVCECVCVTKVFLYYIAESHIDMLATQSYLDLASLFEALSEWQPGGGSVGFSRTHDLNR